jgi:hypothetical protein
MYDDRNDFMINLIQVSIVLFVIGLAIYRHYYGWGWHI